MWKSQEWIVEPSVPVSGLQFEIVLLWIIYREKSHKLQTQENVRDAFLHYPQELTLYDFTYAAYYDDID